MTRPAWAPALLAAGGGGLGLLLLAALVQDGASDLAAVRRALLAAVGAAALALLAEPWARRGPTRLLAVELAALAAALLALPALGGLAFPGLGAAGELGPGAEVLVRLPPAVELAVRARAHPLLAAATLAALLAPLPALLLVARAGSRRLEAVAPAASAGLALVAAGVAWPARAEVVVLAALAGAPLGAALALVEPLDPRPARAAWPAALLAVSLAPLALLAARVPAALPAAAARDAPAVAPLLEAVAAAQAAHVARRGATARALERLDLPEDLAGGYALAKRYLLRYARWRDGRWCVCADPVPWRPGWPSYRLAGGADGAGGPLEVGARPFPLAPPR